MFPSLVFLTKDRVLGVLFIQIPGFGWGLFNPIIMQRPITSLDDLIDDLTPTELEHLADSGYSPEIEMHYWTDKDGEYFVFDSEIPQPE